VKMFRCRCGGEGRNVSDKEAVSVALAEKGHLVINFVSFVVVVVRVIQSHPTTGLTLNEVYEFKDI
jgi:hypothetical protein